MGPDETNGHTKTDETYDQELPGFVCVVPAGPLETTEVESETLIDSSARMIANRMEALLLSLQWALIRTELGFLTFYSVPESAPRPYLLHLRHLIPQRPPTILHPQDTVQQVLLMILVALLET